MREFLCAAFFVLRSGGVGKPRSPRGCPAGSRPRPTRAHICRKISLRRRGGVGKPRSPRGCPAGSRPRPTRAHICRKISLRRRGGVKTPPYGKREHGSSDRRSQQDKIARAACRPPLRPDGNSQFSFFVRNLRKVVGRGLDPAAGTLRQTPRPPHTAQFSYRRRGGVYAARERWGGPERCGQRKFARRGQDPALLHTIRAPHGRPAGRPYSRTGIGNFYFGFAIPARMHKPPVRGGFLFRSGFPHFSTGGFSAVYLCF